jgi:hypothetical protein
MGMSCQGIIFFGYHFEEDSLEDGMPNLYDISTARAEAKGAIRPDYSSCPRGYGAERDAWDLAHADEMDAWSNAVKAEEVGGDVSWHVAGSYDYECGFYVCIGASRLVSEWGSMIDLSTDRMMSTYWNWEQTLREHLTDLDIPLPGHCPRWYLTSLYG